MEAMVQEKSTRLVTAEEIAAFLRDNGLANPYGGDVTRGTDRKGRAYYAVTFARPASLDGVVSVYSHKYFVVKFSTRYKFLPTDATLLFKNKEDLLAFMKAAFVDLDSDAAALLMERVRGES